MGRLVLNVRMNEVSPSVDAIPLSVNVTTVKLTDTGDGYLWTVDAGEKVFDLSFDSKFN